MNIFFKGHVAAGFDVMKTKVDRLAKKMLPIVRRAELAKKRGGGKTDK